MVCGFKLGMRKREICFSKVSWFDLDGEKPVVHIRNDPEVAYRTKDGDNRTVPVSKGAAGFLRAYLAGRGKDEFVLEPNKGWAPATIEKRTICRADFRNRLYAYWGTQGLKGNLNIHDMRRSFASNLATKGENIYKIAKWLGDGLEVTMKHYGHLCSYDTGVDKLD